MKTGSPPTEPKARTGELTPPGIGEHLKQRHAVRQFPAWVAEPAGGSAAGRPGGRRDHVAVAAMPAQARDIGHFLRFAIQVAGPPFALVVRSTAGPDKEMGPVPGADRHRTGPQA